MAQSTQAPAKAGAAVAQPLCVDAEVNGVRTLSYTCLSQQLAPARTANSRDASASDPSERLANGPSNQVGTFNLSAERIRFGSNWGKSALPQRPPPLQTIPIKH